jgi:hypothetical protein
MKFVNKRIFKRQARRHVPLPIEMSTHIKAVSIRAGNSPWVPSRYCRAGRIQKDFTHIEAMPVVSWTINPPSVCEFVRQSSNIDMPMITRTIAAWMQGNFAK